MPSEQYELPKCHTLKHERRALFLKSRMKKVVAATMFCVWPLVAAAAETTDEFSYAQVRAIEIRADEIEMVSPIEFHAKGNVIISGRGDDIYTHTAIIKAERFVTTIEAEALSIE